MSIFDYIEKAIFARYKYTYGISFFDFLRGKFVIFIAVLSMIFSFLINTPLVFIFVIFLFSGTQEINTKLSNFSKIKHTLGLKQAIQHIMFIVFSQNLLFLPTLLGSLSLIFTFKFNYFLLFICTALYIVNIAVSMNNKKINYIIYASTIFIMYLNLQKIISNLVASIFLIITFVLLMLMFKKALKSEKKIRFRSFKNSWSINFEFIIIIISLIVVVQRIIFHINNSTNPLYREYIDSDNIYSKIFPLFITFIINLNGFNKEIYARIVDRQIVIERYKILKTQKTLQLSEFLFPPGLKFTMLGFFMINMVLVSNGVNVKIEYFLIYTIIVYTAEIMVHYIRHRVIHATFFKLTRYTFFDFIIKITIIIVGIELLNKIVTSVNLNFAVIAFLIGFIAIIALIILELTYAKKQ